MKMITAPPPPLRAQSLLTFRSSFPPPILNMDSALTVALQKLVQAVTGDPAPVSVARIVSTDFAHRPATISTDRRTLSVLVATNTKAGTLYRRSPGHVFADALGVLFDRNMAAIQARSEEH